MADVLVQIQPRGAPAFATPVTLEGPTRTVTIRLSFRWLQRIGRWSLRVQMPDQSRDLAMETLIAGNGIIPTDTRDAAAPEGQLQWLGPDPYERADLGQTLRLAFIPAAA